jgi:NAD(P)H-binding
VETPSFAATERIAAYSVSYSPRYSATSRTARSRSSLGYRFGMKTILPSKEVPTKPGGIQCSYGRMSLARRVMQVETALRLPALAMQLSNVLQPLITATIGKTTYRDMRRMEELVRGSDLEWTIMRPSGLFDAPGVTRYELHQDQAPGIFTSRADLAASMLEQATQTWYVARRSRSRHPRVPPRCSRCCAGRP